MILYNSQKRIPFILVSGTSGAGKTWLTEKLSTRKFKTVKTYTTREPRFEGEFYNFLSNEEMNKIFPDFIQSFFSGNDRYGCGIDDVMDIVEDSKIPIIVVSPSGVTDILKSVEEKYPEIKFSMLYIHIACHPEEALFNIKSFRNDNEQAIAQRIFDTDIKINAMFEDFLEDHSYDFIKDGYHSFEVVDSSLGALEFIIDFFSKEEIEVVEYN